MFYYLCFKMFVRSLGFICHVNDSFLVRVFYFTVINITSLCDLRMMFTITIATIITIMIAIAMVTVTAVVLYHNHDHDHDHDHTYKSSHTHSAFIDNTKTCKANNNLITYLNMIKIRQKKFKIS